jgi:hypothetical protein
MFYSIPSKRQLMGRLDFDQLMTNDLVPVVLKWAKVIEETAEVRNTTAAALVNLGGTGLRGQHG